MRQTIKRWGNSPAVRIPAHMMTLMNMDIDEEVEVTVQTDSNNVQHLVIQPVRQVTSENIHGETDFGEAQGQEVW